MLRICIAVKVGMFQIAVTKLKASRCDGQAIAYFHDELSVESALRPTDDILD